MSLQDDDIRRLFRLIFDKIVCGKRILDADAREIFTPEPFMAYRTSRNLEIYLVNSKVPPLVREKGCKKCNKSRCLTCQNIRETDPFGAQWMWNTIM